MIRRPPRSTPSNSSAASDVYKRQALQPAASALVVTEPVPGLAEQMEEEKEQYLKEKLASMTAAEQKQLIEQTAAFHDWNSRERSNMDFLIGPGELPEPPESSPFTKRQWGTITCYTSPAPSRDVGSYQLYFDISGIGLSLIHISEPTRQEAISYAVFCLKKKNFFNDTATTEIYTV